MPRYTTPGQRPDVNVFLFLFLKPRFIFTIKLISRENLREWDLEKEDLGEMKKEWKVLTQQEWLDRQRQQRNTEFAPPSAFNEARVLLQQKEEAFIKAQAAKRKLPKPAPKVAPLPPKPAAAAAPTGADSWKQQAQPEEQQQAATGWYIDNQPSMPFPEQLEARSWPKPALDPMALLGRLFLRHCLSKEEKTKFFLACFE